MLMSFLTYFEFCLQLMSNWINWDIDRWSFYYSCLLFLIEGSAMSEEVSWIFFNLLTKYLYLFLTKWKLLNFTSQTWNSCVRLLQLPHPWCSSDISSQTSTSPMGACSGFDQMGYLPWAGSVLCLEAVSSSSYSRFSFFPNSFSLLWNEQESQ